MIRLYSRLLPGFEEMLKTFMFETLNHEMERNPLRYASQIYYT